MSHFARVVDGKVAQVIVIEQEQLDTGLWGDPVSWIQTSYNTSGNQHKLGGTPLRGNYAGIGYTYDAEHDVFYEPQPFESWTLNTSTWLWEAPIPYPQDNKDYYWDETNQQWVEVNNGTN